MLAPMRWIDRKFNFDFPIGTYPMIVARLRGTPARIEDLVKGLSEGTITAKPDGKWSIKEHIGHLIEVEVLWKYRLDQFEKGVKSLVAADMSNQATEKADYNARPIAKIVRDFRLTRSATIARLEAYDEAFIARAAHHPRLNQPMRVIDMAFFGAEHDDQHLALIAQIISSAS